MPRTRPQAPGDRPGSKTASAASPRRPGRPAEFDRSKAIEAALTGFWRHGFEAMSTSTLARAMGIERSSFYNSFGSREDLFVEVLRRYGELVPDRTLAQIKPGEPVTPVVVSAFREICRVRAADPDGRGCMLVNSIVTLVGANPTLAPLISAAVQRQTELVERLLRQAVNQREIDSPADVHAAAVALVTFLVGLNVISRVIRSEAELWRMCQRELKSHGFRLKA